MKMELPAFPQTFKLLCGVPFLLSSALFRGFFPIFFFLFVYFPFSGSEPTVSFPQSHLCQSSLIQKQGRKHGLREDIKHWSALCMEKGKSFTHVLTVLEGGIESPGINVLVFFFLSLSLSFCLRWMEVLWFAACTLLDFSFEGLMSWIIMFWGFWCFLAFRRTGNERKFITVYS